MTEKEPKETKKLIFNSLNKEEESKSILKLQEQRKKYPEVTEVQISNDIITKILNSIQNSSSFGQKKEGVIFGRETEKQLIISTLIPCNISESAINLYNYLDTSRLDSTKIGFYFCDEGSELLSQNRLKTFIEFQKNFPNSVILFIDINALKTNMYPFKCFRISNKIMDEIEGEEIEENIYLTTKDNIRDFYKKVFKKMNPTIELIQPLKLTTSNDIMNIFETFADKIYVNDSENDRNNFYYHSKDVSYNLNRKLKELNKNCGKIIEEQKKYIDYYKNKKAHLNDINPGKEEGKEIMAGGAKTTEDKFDLIDFGLYSQNIKGMNEAIKNIINKKEIDSFTAFNLV